MCHEGTRSFCGSIYGTIPQRSTAEDLKIIFSPLQGNFSDDREIQFDDDRTGVVVWSSSVERINVERISAVSMNHYPWISLFCHFFNVTNIPPMLWLSECCDALLITEGFLEVDEEHLVYNDRQEYQQILVFSSGRLNLACNKCGLTAIITNLEDAIVEPSPFNKTLICTSESIEWYFTVEFANGSEPRVGSATGGFEFWLIEDVSNHLGFEYAVQESPGDASWGALINGTWTGRLDHLAKRRVHFALGDVTILYPRNLCFDHTYPHDFDVLAFVSKLKTRTLSSSVFIKLMDAGCWLALLALTMTTCTLLVVTRKFNNMRASAPSVIFRATEFIYGALVQPTMAFPYKTRSGFRVVELIWTTGLFFLGKALSGSLVMFIASPGFEAIIDTMKDCATFFGSHRDSRLCMELGNYENFFDKSNDVIITPEAAEISKYVNQECMNWPDRQIVDEILRGANVLWFSEKTVLTAEFLTAASRGGKLNAAHVSKDHLNVMHQGILLQRGCAFSTAFQNATRILFETGHIIHYKRKLDISELPPVVTERTFSPLELSSISDFVTSTFIVESAMILALLIELSAVILESSGRFR